MKRHSLTLGLAITLLAGNLAPSFADVYVKVDAQGNAIGGAIMCDAQTCAAGSQYSQLTLQAGEQYVLQGNGQAGIGNNNPDTQVKVDIPTQTWTITTPTNIQTFVPATNPYVEQPKVTFATPTQVVETKTVMSDTSTITVETQTALTLGDAPSDYNSPDWWDRFLIWITAYLEQVFGKVK